MAKSAVPAPRSAVVLIVDDVPDIRLAYRLLLEAADFTVLEAWNGTDALGCLANNRVDVVLTDLYMPGQIDGVGLVEIIRKRMATQPAIIAMSGSPNLAYRSSLQAARIVGADVALTKPLQPEILVRTIRSLIGGGPALAGQA
jgi:two-component system nitrogen regulation response regulator NtrX